MRRSPVLLSLVTSAVVATAVAGCGTNSGNSAGGGSAGGGGTITLGLIAPLTGTFSQAGTDMQNGAKIAVDQINAAGGVNGKKLALDIKDDGSSPQKTAQAARDLTSAGHNLIFGALSSAECGAVKGLIPAAGGVYIATTCVSPDITGTPGQPGTANVFRTGLSNAPEEKLVQDQPKIINDLVPGIATWDYFGYDYSFGHEQEAAFEANMKRVAPSVTIGSTVYAPLNSQNFRPYVTQLANGVNADANGRALFLGTYGAGSSSFFQQADSFSFLDKYKMIFTTGDPWDVLSSLNGRFPQLWTWYDYMWPAYDNKTNTAFVEQFKSTYNKMPGGWSAETFNGVQAYAAAIEKAKSSDPAAVSKALAGLSYPSLQGTQTIDATTHQADTNIVTSNAVGDPSSPDGVKILRTVIVRPDGTYSDGKTTLTLN